MLQKDNGLTIAVTEDDWDSTPRCSVDVRRAFVVPDILREAKKKRFVVSNLLRVSTCYV